MPSPAALSREHKLTVVACAVRDPDVAARIVILRGVFTAPTSSSTDDGEDRYGFERVREADHLALEQEVCLIPLL
jgi:hypothetical protein